MSNDVKDKKAVTVQFDMPELPPEYIPPNRKERRRRGMYKKAIDRRAKKEQKNNGK